MDFLIGQIVPFGGSFAPKGWMLCDGTLLPIARYTALFSILGTYYGGNGTTTFALPDLRGSVAISPGQAPGRGNYDLGQTGGSEKISMSVQQMPMHTHDTSSTVAINVNDSRAAGLSPNNTVLSQPSDVQVYTADPDGSSTMNSGAVTLTATVDPAGSGSPFPNFMPYLTVNYCICVEGIFPQRP